MNWLLLRGLSRETRHWGNFPERMGARLGAQVHTLDLPGAGSQNLRTAPDSVSEIVDDLRKRWIDLRSSHPTSWRILGLSLGGMCAMDWCARYGSDFEKIVIINSSAANLGTPLRRMSPLGIFKILSLLFGKNLLKREKEILKLTTRLKKPGEIDSIAGDWAALAEKNPVSRHAFLSQIRAAARFKAPSRLDVAPLILCSEKDALVSSKCSLRLKELLGCPLASHPEAGHDLPLDDPDWVIGQIENQL